MSANRPPRSLLQVWCPLLCVVAAVAMCLLYAIRRDRALSRIAGSGALVTYASAEWAPAWLRGCAPAWSRSVFQVDYRDEYPDVHSLQVLSEIEELTVNCPTVGDDSLAAIAHLGNLKMLSIRGTRMSDEGLAVLRRLRLRRLDIAETKVTDDGLKYLSEMPLQMLSLERTGVSGRGFTALKDVPLASLFLGESDVSDAGLALLSGLPISELRMDRTRVTDGGMIGISLPNLKVLSLTRTRVTDESAQMWSDLELTELYIAGTEIGDAGVRKLPFKSLTHLDLRGTLVTDAAEEYLGSLQNVRDLWLPCPPMTRGCIERLGERLGLQVVYGRNSAALSAFSVPEAGEWNEP